VKIHCFWLISSKLTLLTSAYFCHGLSHIMLRDVFRLLVWMLWLMWFDRSSWSPPHASYRLKRYQNQPMKIENYEPGMSSVVLLDPYVVSCVISHPPPLSFALPIKGLQLKTGSLLIVPSKPFENRFHMLGFSIRSVCWTDIGGLFVNSC